MTITKLYLQNFRNYKEEHLELEEVNIIYGDNAQGKTNILEAIYMFSLGLSHRTYRDKEMIMFDKDTAKIGIEYVSHEMKHTSEIELDKRKKKLIKINGAQVEKNSELIGKLNVVMFCPEHLSLVKEGPAARRRNIDIFISSLRPRYFSLLKQYKKLILNKNALLKKIKQNPRLEPTLAVWNEEVCKVGAEIIKYRQEYIKKLNEKCAAIHSKITVGKEMLAVKYSRGESCSPELLMAEIQKNYRRELDYAEALVGPHRDDIEFHINEREVKNYGSQGQQKTAVLSHKLAEVEIICEESGEYPVLLLDDIFSELDRHRRDYLLKNINNIQVFITCTDKEQFEKLPDCKMFHVKSGTAK